ncbi:hypothetical protein [Pseudaestuariivita atlantica]|uniref:Uncharacterized protein n=1 Tax=Pseudaestuariivita atlantica TaxID=1317121 RepID=A0A0L1JNP4_9RHOB|nr:hypothetical protein [Pseudaestuariivita atlantica]KNG92998.1 hypothetical protein ATO11_13800 [Pseudaestuariivita atlantica]
MTSLLDLLTRPFRRSSRRPLSYRQPQMGRDAEVPLGMEALDMTEVDRVNRRNDALERVTLAGKNRFGRSFTQNAASRIDPMPDDETYAAEYHRRFNR